MNGTLMRILVSTSSSFDYTFFNEGDYEMTLIVSNEENGCLPDTSSAFISLYCPWEPTFDYQIIGDSIQLIPTTSQDINHEWTITTAYGDTVFHSSEQNPISSIVALEYIKVCHSVYDTLCQEIKCSFINTSGSIDEICDNEVDDDNDGLIDAFDPDCPCSDDLFQAQCIPDCEFLPDSFSSFGMKLKW
jgi:hypothetical protein